MHACRVEITAETIFRRGKKMYKEKIVKVSEHLLRCPICGDNANVKIVNQYSTTTIVVGCENPSCFCRFITGLGMAPPDYVVDEYINRGVKSWNTRHGGREKCSNN